MKIAPDEMLEKKRKWLQTKEKGRVKIEIRERCGVEKKRKKEKEKKPVDEKIIKKKLKEK